MGVRFRSGGRHARSALERYSHSAYGKRLHSTLLRVRRNLSPCQKLTSGDTRSCDFPLKGLGKYSMRADDSIDADEARYLCAGE